jgi:hypothetical protein
MAVVRELEAMMSRLRGRWFFRRGKSPGDLETVSTLSHEGRTGDKTVILIVSILPRLPPA